MTAPRKSPIRDKTLPALVISFLFILFIAVLDALRPETGTANSAPETKSENRTKSKDRARTALPPKTKRHHRRIEFNTPGYWEQEARRSTDQAHAILENNDFDNLTEGEQAEVRNHYKAAQACWEMADQSK